MKSAEFPMMKELQSATREQMYNKMMAKKEMNKRILKLADKAIEDMPGAWNIPDEFCKKFAELIVRECMEEVMTYQHHTNPTREMVPFIVEDIKQHFGVEE